MKMTIHYDPGEISKVKREIRIVLSEINKKIRSFGYLIPPLYYQTPSFGNYSSLLSYYNFLREINLKGFLDQKSADEFVSFLRFVHAPIFRATGEKKPKTTSRAKANWDSYMSRSKGWSARISFELLHGLAFKSLRYAPAIKVLIYFHEKIKVNVDRRKRGNKRYKVVDEPMRFTYHEAECRGLSRQQFSKALKVLHECGFLDVVTHGSGLEGDFSEYALSNRWRQYRTSEFKKVKFPESPSYGFRSFAT